MATSIRLRGGTTSQHSTFTGAAKEVTVDTDKNTVVVHDGATAGGFPLVAEDANGDVALSGGLTVSGSTALNGNVTATGHFAVRLDSDDNQGGRAFIVQNFDGTYSAFRAAEGGDIYFYDAAGVQGVFWDASESTLDVTGELTADSYNETYAAVTSSSNATTVDCEAGNAFSHTLTENTTFTFSNPPASGTAYTFSLEIIQDASASGYTVTFPAAVDWPSATAPTLTATADARDVFVFYTRDGGTTWLGFTAGQALG